jgi:hypothetical protein
MTESHPVFRPHGAPDAEVLPGLSSPASPCLSCALSKIALRWQDPSESLAYSASDFDWTFTDPCALGSVLFRNAVAHDGQDFEVRSVSPHVFGHSVSAVCISRSVARLGNDCFFTCYPLEIVAFEAGSQLREIGSQAFCRCRRLLSIAIPSFVGSLGPSCFSYCLSLGSVTFEPPSRLATIERETFLSCESLNCLSIPAAVTAIRESAFHGAGIRSITIEDGSVSFRVVNEFLLDFEERSLVFVMGSPETIEIPSAIQEIRPRCCCLKSRLKTVEFAADSNLRSIGESAFASCKSLESICIPSAVEVVPDSCFVACPKLRMVTFGEQSKLRLIERFAFESCPSLKPVSVPASVEVIGRQPVSLSRRHDGNFRFPAVNHIEGKMPAELSG